MKNDLRSLVDQTLSELEWDEQQRQKVLYVIREEEKPVKKRYASLILAVLLICLSVTALAAGLLFSPRYDAVRLANAAMEENYGMTADLLSLFHRTVEIHADGSATVTYAAPRADFPSEQMGDYRVQVSGGEVQVCWSNDGMDTSGGLSAKAWGKEQLSMLSYDYASTMQQLLDQQGLPSPTPMPAAIAEHVWTEADEAAAQAALDMAEHDNQQRLTEIAKAEKAGKISAAKAAELARQAVCQEYSLTESQCSKLIFEPDSTFITYENEQPMAHLLFWLWQRDDETFTIKDGQYWVTVNMTTCMIEDILYDAGLAGNG